MGVRSSSSSSSSRSSRLFANLRATVAHPVECVVTSSDSYSVAIRASLAFHEHWDARYLVVSNRVVPIAADPDRRPTGGLARERPSEVPLDGWRWRHGFAMMNYAAYRANPRECLLFYADGVSVHLPCADDGDTARSVFDARVFARRAAPGAAFASHPDGCLVHLDDVSRNLCFAHVARFHGSGPASTARSPVSLPSPQRPMGRTVSVSIAVDAGGNCYALDHAPQRVIVYGRNVSHGSRVGTRCASAWTTVADVMTDDMLRASRGSNADREPASRRSLDRSVSLVADAFRRRLYLVSGVAVYAVDLLCDVADADRARAACQTRVRLVADAALDAAAGGSGGGGVTPFFEIRSCVLETRPLVFDRDILPALRGIRAGIDTSGTSDTPPGLAELIESYARSPALPARRLVLHDATPTGAVLRFVELPAESRKFV